MALSSGSRLGSYEILSPLGAGGMGEVYRARDTRLAREVAVKVLPEELASDPERLRRFEREARAASALSHPNIVTIYEVAQADQTSFIAMELVEGKTLRELAAGAALPFRKILSIAPQIAEGLAKAHSAGIVHRDLKPENVMVTGDGIVKILDFGLAKLTHPQTDSGQTVPGSTVSAATRPGIALGTVSYMSPEQASGHPVDYRSDQFSLGSMLYEMAAGKPAFKRPTTAQTLASIIEDEPEPIGSAAPKTPAPLRWVIERCLSKEPKGRYASTEDLARELCRPARSRLGAVERLGHCRRGTTAANALAPCRRTRRGRRGAHRNALSRAKNRAGQRLDTPLPPAHVSRRRDRDGALRAGQPDDRLLGAGGGPATGAPLPATRRLGDTFARAAPGANSFDVLCGRDGSPAPATLRPRPANRPHRPRTDPPSRPLPPCRHARPGFAGRRRTTRDSRGRDVRRLGPERQRHRRDPPRRQREPHRVSHREHDLPRGAQSAQLPPGLAPWAPDRVQGLG